MEALHIEILIILLLQLVAAFFSAAETAMTAASRAKIFGLQTEGNKRAQIVAKLREDKDRLIAALLLGNNVVNIAASALATATSIRIFGEEGVLIATVIMTMVIVIFTEVMPKAYAFRHAESVALTLAPIVAVVVKVLIPATIAVQAVVKLVMRVFGAKKEDVAVVGTEALRGAIELHHHEGSVHKEDRDMLGSILDLEKMNVEEIMVHRKKMQSINIDEPRDAIIEQVLSSAYTRLPVWQGEGDNMIGVLHAKALLKELKNNPEALSIQGILMKPWFIPASTTVKDQLAAFLERKVHFAFVVDEYGALLGLVTLEDILEEIVGQIEDEHDKVEDKMKIVRQENDACIVDGMITIRDLNREMNWNLSDEEATTIAGLVIHKVQKIPKKGQVFVFDHYRFEILQKQRHQITLLKIARLQSPESAEGI